MPPEHHYKPVRSIPVEGRSLDSVDDVQVPTNSLPFRSGHLADLCRFVVTSRGENQTSPQLVQISPAEKRTFEVRYGKTDQILFKDQYGNLFACFDLKGNKGTFIKVTAMPNTPSGFNFWGLLDGDSIARGLRASDYVRSQQIDTEIILKVMEMDQIWYRGRLMTVADFKHQLLLDTFARVTSENSQKDKLTPFDIPRLALVLNGMDFFQTFRGKQVNERLIDLEDASPEALTKMIGKAFWFYNYRQSSVPRDKDQKPFKPLRTDNPNDIAEYFLRILPRAIGRNYGKLHDAGCVHVHPHLQNIALTGGIYDTDSIRGEPLGLGDKPITDEDVLTDLRRLLYGYWNNYEGKGFLKLFKNLFNDKRIPTNEGTFSASISELNLFMEYFYTRKWDEDPFPHLPLIKKLVNHPQPALFSFIPGFVVRKVGDSGDWKYKFEFSSVDEVAEEMFRKDLRYWRRLLNGKADDYSLIKAVLKKSFYIATDIIRDRIYQSKPEAFEGVANSHGKETSDALLTLIVMEIEQTFPYQLFERMFGPKPQLKDHDKAINYIQDKIK